MNVEINPLERIVESLRDYYAQSDCGGAELRVNQPAFTPDLSLAYMFPLASVVDTYPEGIRELASPLSDY